MELTSFASGSLLSQLPGAPVSEDGQSLVQGSWGKKTDRAADWSCLSVGLQRQVLTDLYFASYLYNVKIWKINFSLAFAEASYLFYLSEFLSPF